MAGALGALGAISIAATAVAVPVDVAATPPKIDFGDAAPGTPPTGWFVPTPAWKAEIVTDADGGDLGGRSVVRLSLAGEAGADPFGNLMRTLPAEGLAGTRVALTARVKVVDRGRAQMWLRVDNADGSMGAFDNMGDRPIHAGDWFDARIVAEIDRDAQSVNVGFMAFGGGTVLIASPTITILGEAIGGQAASDPAPLDGRALDNVVAASRLLSYLRFFHPSDQCVGIASWDHVAVALVEAAEPAADASDLAERLSATIAGIAPTVRIFAGEPDAAPTVTWPPDDATHLSYWRHRGAGSVSSMSNNPIYRSVVEQRLLDAVRGDEAFWPLTAPLTAQLGGGVSVWMPIAVAADDSGTLPHGATPEKWSGTEALPQLTTSNRATRLASVALAWGVFQHFYPYFDVVEEHFGVDWDAALPTALRAAAEADGPAAHVDVLRELVAELHDGHGRVVSSRVRPTSRLPLALEWAGDDLVVVDVDPEVAGSVDVGDAVVAVDGRPIEACHAELARRISAGTDGWLRWMTANAMRDEYPTENPASLTLRSPDGIERIVMVPRVPPSEMPRGRTVGRIANGAAIGDPDDRIVYFDLRGTDFNEFMAKLPALARAKAIVFDLRGYPDSAAFRMLHHLITGPTQSPRWMTPIITRPDRDRWSWDESGRWNLSPLSPRLDQPIAFLTDGSAISYAESIMGIVEHHQLGAIVGSPTAGANGNINPFALPGGDVVIWTGMKVLKHDGTRHHALGNLPTVPVEPTQQGIAEGRDEVLERAVEVLKSQLEATERE